MTPLEKARAEEGRVNYCDECEQFEIVGKAAYAHSIRSVLGTTRQGAKGTISPSEIFPRAWDSRS